jgi:hypothetical protein
VLGILAIIAPFVLGFSGVMAALWASIILGAIELILSLFDVFAVRPASQLRP